MNRNVEKLIIIAICFTVLVPLLALSFSGTGGFLIRATDNSVIYLLKDSVRYVFPNRQVYQSWYGNDFTAVQTVPFEELGWFPLGGSVTIKPGTLIKSKSDSRVYVVLDDYGSMAWVASEEVARNAFGADWSKLVRDLPDAFFVNYQVSASPFLPILNPISTTTIEVSTTTAQISTTTVSVSTTTSQISTTTNPVSVPGSTNFASPVFIACTDTWSCGDWSTCLNRLQTRTCAKVNNCASNINQPPESQACVPNTCTENWSCGSWSACANGSRTRTCSELNNCGTEINKPAFSQACCAENWICGDWGSCSSSQQTRSCTDLNNCGTDANRPALSQACVCSENWACEDWSLCENGSTHRNCTDLNSCGTITNRPAESLTCGNSCGDGIADPGEECDDGNQNEGDNCTNLCANNWKCKDVMVNGPQESRYNIVFIADYYTSANIGGFPAPTNPLDYKVIDGFENRINTYVDYLFSLAPFNVLANKNKLNIYRMDHLGSIRPTINGVVAFDYRTYWNLSDCGKVDLVVVVESRDGNVGTSYSFAVPPMPFMVMGYSVPKTHDKETFTHEFGHAFGGLGDEYTNSHGLMTRAAANADTWGCPKWCTGQFNPNATIDVREIWGLNRVVTTVNCTDAVLQIKSCIEALFAANPNVQDGGSCYDESKFMYYDTSYRGYLSYLRYIPMCNVGVCPANYGCYYNANSLQLFKSSVTSIMNPTLPNDPATYTYNKASQDAIQQVFDGIH